MIPGSNLLNTAMSVITKQEVIWYRFLRNEINDIGTEEAVYAPAVNVRGSWQPVPRRLYQNLGLDFNNIYVTFYAPKCIIDVQRDISGDQLNYCGKRYQVLQANDWTQVDGWTGVLCVQLGDKNAR